MNWQRLSIGITSCLHVPEQGFEKSILLSTAGKLLLPFKT